MAEYYLALRHAHIGFVILSIGLFVLRGGLMLAQSPLVHAAWLRYPSYAIDTSLLTAALMLTSVDPPVPVRQRLADDEGRAARRCTSCLAVLRSSGVAAGESGSPRSWRPC